MTSIRSLLPAPFSDAVAADSDAGRLQRYGSTFSANPARSTVAPTPTRNALIRTIRQTVRETAGIDCRVELISRRIGLPLTSSGKLSRSRAKARLLAGGYDQASLAHPA